MLRQIIFASLVSIGSALTLVNPTIAQTSSAEVNQLLNQTNQVIKDANNYNKNVAIPAGQRYQNYLNQLYQSCLNGNSSACQQYQSRTQKQIRWQNHLNRQYETWAKNRRF